MSNGKMFAACCLLYVNSFKIHFELLILHSNNIQYIAELTTCIISDNFAAKFYKHNHVVIILLQTK